MSNTVVDIDQLRVIGPVRGEERVLVADCTLQVGSGEAVALVGESGSGKTLSVRAIAGLLPARFRTEGVIRIDGEDIAGIPSARLRQIRAHRIGMIFQTPRAHVNPLRTIGDFMTEALVAVARTRAQDATAIAEGLLAEVGVSDPRRRMAQRPGELSGGLLQRVMIAATLAMDPRILLADEITTALDVTTQEEVMAVIADLRRERDLAMLFITHDLALARAVCDRVSVMKDGRVIETQTAARIRHDAADPYTRTLLNASLELTPLPGRSDHPDDPILEVKGVGKTFRVTKASGIGAEDFIAVDDVSFSLSPGRALGIVGESGSGKSTTARIVCGLETADRGSVVVKGRDWTRPARSTSQRRDRASVVQMVFQDPYQSLDPRQRVRDCLAEALGVHDARAVRPDTDHRIDELMDAVRLDRSLLDARPRALSGGQRQRVAIARALAAEPEILVLDEAVSALDVTTQIEILTLLDTIRRETGVALLMISHDLNVVRRLCDHVVVMRAGRVEENGPIDRVLDHPTADYTRALIDSIPRDGWSPTRRLPVHTATSPIVSAGPRTGVFRSRRRF